MRKSRMENTMKTRKMITVDRELLEWVEKQIESKRFASFSHAVEYALTKLKDRQL